MRMKLRSPLSATSGNQTSSKRRERSADAQVVEGCDAQPAARPAAHDRSRQDHPEHGVHGEEDEVVGDDRATQPEHDAVGIPGQVERAGQRVGCDREGREDAQQVDRAGPVAVAEPAHHANTIAPTHLVQCTPGSAGTITRAG